MSTAWFSKALLPWYAEHQRPLPWRRTHDPYRIWLSEVILQQTRVEQGLPYWQRFVDTYPTVVALAAASEDAVLKLWQGLGYYSRARNLRTAAQQVVMEHGGRFPDDHDSLLRLKGVGDYTAAAIGSIAFGTAEPVVDGNVYRVLARVFGISTPIDSTAGRKEFRALASNLLDRSRPGEHNQAVMELGATVCTPVNPRCSECPLARKCVARATDRRAQLPVKAGKTTVRTRYFNYLHIGSGTTLYLQKRSGRDVWQGLWELPLMESPAQLTRAGLKRRCDKELGGRWEVLVSTGPVKHVLSHQLIMATFWRVRPLSHFTPPVEWQVVKDPRHSGHAVPRLIERYWQEHFVTKAARR